MTKLALAQRILLACFLAASPALADSAYPQSYQLRNLRPLGLTFLSGSPARQLLQFQNEHGAQNILYEENPQVAPVREVASLSPFLAVTANLCSIDIDCRSKAFCTNNCLSYFYEISNLPFDKTKPERDNCVIRSFSCSSGRTPEQPGAGAAPGQQRTAAPATQTVIIGPAPALAPKAQ